MNSDCVATRACIRSKCQDPCPGACGANAECQVVNHLPTCTCFPGYTGQPYQFCQPMAARPSKHLEFFLTNNLLRVRELRAFYNTFSLPSCRGQERSMFSVALRTEQSLPGCQRPGSLYLSARVHRFSTGLSTRVCSQLRVSS